MATCLKIGVDVGGTKIAAGLVAADGKIIKRYHLLTEAQAGRAEVLDNIKQAIAAVWDYRVGGIGIGFAGLVDHKRGVVVRGPNFPKDFRNVNLVSDVGRAFGVPVSIDNDARCFTLGEAVFGLGKGKKLVVGLTVGTGIGGGLVLDGQPWRGRDMAAGEIGHVVIASDSHVKCSCGKFGHLEGLASGPAISRHYRKLTGKQTLPTDIQRLAARGNRAAKRTVAECGAYLGAGIANVIQTANPDVIIIGGGVSRDVQLVNAAIKSCRGLLLHPETGRTPILRSKLGGDAMILGAAQLIA